MKGHTLEEFNKPYVLREDISTPEIKEDLDVIIQVEAASFCHTDELLRTGQRAVLPKLPFVGCHEFAGRITAIGSRVENFKVGDKVGVPTKGFHSCGQCKECMWTDFINDDPGYSVYCPQSKELGLNVPGGFAEYALVDSRTLTRIPDNMTALDTAPLMCAGLTIYTALIKCQLNPSQGIGIIGAGGGLGHLGMQFAEKMGLKTVVAIDAADGPLKLVRKIASPSTLVIDARESDASEVRKQVSMQQGMTNDADDQQGLDVVIILTDSQTSFDYGMKLLRRHGTMMIVSIPPKFQITPADICRRDIKILGSQVGSVKMLREMMSFVGEHGVRSVSRVYPFEQLNQLVEDSHNTQGGKYVLEVSSSTRS